MFGLRISEREPERLRNLKTTGLRQSCGIGPELVFQGLGFQEGTLFQSGQ